MAMLLLYLGGHTRKSVRKGIPQSYVTDLAELVAARRFGPDADDWRTWIGMLPHYKEPPAFDKVFPDAGEKADDTHLMTAAQLVKRARHREAKT